MIDHVLGRPSVKSRRLQVLAVLLLWSAVLFRGHRHGPPGTRSVSRLLTAKLTAWQVILTTLLSVYGARNLSTLVGLSAPEPLGGMYDPTYFRATWIMTALDAGFWTAMPIRSRWVRDIASMFCSVFYLFAAERADEKVRKVRGMVTVEHLRVSWGKGTTPYLGFLSRLLRPRLTRWPPRAIRIPRPATSDYKDAVAAWLYYDGPVSDLRRHTRVILDVPGGGFISMDPRCHDDRLLAWATRTGLPVLSLDYHKAPEYPYPYALNECFDVYTTMVNTRGKCLGFSGAHVPHIVVTGDSAGGNLAVAMTLMIIERNLDSTRHCHFEMPLPGGLMLCYPSLDMNIGNWMTDEQMSLIQDRRMRRTNKSIVRRKSMQYASLVGTPHHSDDEDETPPKSTLDDLIPLPAAASAAATASTRTAPPTRTTTPSARVNSAPAALAPAAPLTPQPEYSHCGPLAFGSANGHQQKQRKEQKQKQKRKQKQKQEQQQEQERDNEAPMQMAAASASTSHHPESLHTRLATSSMISYFNDRVLTPEMMRAMIILYIGPHSRPDFSSEYFLSPILAPDSLLERFPKTYFLTGERDPLVDDTVIFAGRLRRVKEALFHRNHPPPGTPSSPDLHLHEAFSMPTLPASASAGAEPENPVFNEKDVAEVTLIPGISHGFMQVPGLYPPAWKWFDRCAMWMDEMFAHADWVRQRERRERNAQTVHSAKAQGDESIVPGGPADAEVGDDGAGAGTSEEKLRHHRRMESSGSDMFLEMNVTRTRSKRATKQNGATTRAGSPPIGADDGNQEEGGQDAANVSARPGRVAGRRRGGRKDRGLVRLESTDDLLGRRMQGLTGGLAGLSGDSP